MHITLPMDGEFFRLDTELFLSCELFAGFSHRNPKACLPTAKKGDIVVGFSNSYPEQINSSTHGTRLVTSCRCSVKGLRAV